MSSQKLKRKRQSSQRASEAILDAAVATMVQNGDQKFMLNEVARRLNISPSTIHHYFQSKEALMAAVKARLNRSSVSVAVKMGAP
jgi:AcrR family transcriptional regulator